MTTAPSPPPLINPRPVQGYLPGLTTMQEHLGDLNSSITRSVADGQLTFLERSELQIRLRGIAAHCEALLQILA